MHSIAVPVHKTGSRKIYISIAAAVVAFLAYTCVYAFRKPFTVLNYQHNYWNIGYQTLLIIAQIGGYMLSKFAGIRFISELRKNGRFVAAVVLVVAGWLCLLAFAIVPDEAGLFFLFVNGFTLGFLWGIIFSYLEGRTMSDMIGAFMAVSFIFAGGFTRSVGKWVLIEWNVGDKWMPFITGLIFILPLVALLYILDRIPPPDARDIEARERRVPMSGKERVKLLRSMGTGLIVIVTCYVILTVMRDLRDNYMSIIWQELGYTSDYGIFARTESITSLVILAAMASIVLFRNNFAAFKFIHLVIIAGFISAYISSFLFSKGILSGPGWMQLVGIGLYLGYIPFNCVFFERMIASFRIHGSVGFLMYFADSFGYLGSLSVMMYKEFFSNQAAWTDFYSHAVQITSLVGIAGTLYSLYFFKKKYSCLEKKQSLSAVA